MALPIIPLIALFIVFGLLIYQYAIVPAFLSPLAKVPAAHWSAPFSRVWILRYRLRWQETPVVHAAHQRLGPIIRLAPNELSINSVENGIRTVYGGGYAKGDWYQNAFTNYSMSMPMFAMPDNTAHSKRRRLLSNIYAKSTLQASAGLTTISQELIEGRLIPRMREVCRQGQPMEMYDLFANITTDFVCAYVFGLENASDFVRNPAYGDEFFRSYKARQHYQVWTQEVPGLMRFLTGLGMKQLVFPQWMTQNNMDIESWILAMCVAAEKSLLKSSSTEKDNRPENYPTVYGQLRNALMKDGCLKTDMNCPVEQLVHTQRLDVASEMLDHTVAGFDTSSITLVYFAWELSRLENRQWQERLRAEIFSLEDKHDAKAVDALPVLQAVLMETLRLHTAIPGNQPRITPPAASLGPPGHTVDDIPAGVRVQAQAWSLHRNPDVFPDPDAWRPERWLETAYESRDAFEAQQREMSRWFWAFGSGGRMCVGSNLAMYDMKAIIVGIWSAFSTSVAFDVGMTHAGGYESQPVGEDGKYLLLNLEEVQA